jgi:hypothetical protein
MWMHSSNPAVRSLGSSLLNDAKKTKLIRSTKITGSLYAVSLAIDGYDIYHAQKKGARSAGITTTGVIFSWAGSLGGGVVCGFESVASLGGGAWACGGLVWAGGVVGTFTGRELGGALYRPGYWLGGKVYDLYHWMKK